MRFAILAFLATAGCASPEGRSPLLPVDFTLFVARHELDGSGSISGPHGDPHWSRDTDSDADGWSVGGSLTWALFPRPTYSPDMRELARELRAYRLAEHRSLMVPVEVEPMRLTPVEPEPVLLERVPEPDPEPAEPAPEPEPTPSTPAADDEPDHEHPPGPIPVSDSTTQIILAIVGLIGTIGVAYLSRNRIPYVRDHTAQGRARKAREGDGEA